MKKMLTVVIITFMISGLGTTAWAAIFSNGSFEIGTNPGPSFTELLAGSNAIDSWDISSGAIDYIGGYWTASDGSRSIDLNMGYAGSISQTFDTVSGQQYKILFDLAGNPVGGPMTKIMNVSADGNSQDFNFDVTGNSQTSMGWVEESFEFVALGSESTLTFSSLIGGSYGPAIDNVRVVPIPAAIWLLGSGILGLLGIRRKFNK